MNIEIPDSDIEDMIKSAVRNKVDDLFKYNGETKDRLNRSIDKAFNSKVETIDVGKLVSDKIDSIFDDAAESYLRQKGKEAVKKAFKELCVHENNGQIELKI